MQVNILFIIKFRLTIAIRRHEDFFLYRCELGYIQNRYSKKSQCLRVFAFDSYCSACTISAMISSTFSIPTERRIKSGRTPAAISCSSVS